MPEPQPAPESKPAPAKKTSFKPLKENAGTERLQVALSRFGIGSRRGVVEAIEGGLVKVNGEVVREKGLRVDPNKDVIEVEGRTLDISAPRNPRYFMLNKPRGVMTTMQDPNAEHTVADFFRDVPSRLFPVGRLDRDTTGLLLMTDDGELAFRLMHPRFGVTKRYRAAVEGAVPDEALRRLAKGVELEEGKTAPCKIDLESRDALHTTLFITLHEGKKRQIRRIFQSVGFFVTDLERIQYGPVTVEGLKPGQRRELTHSEVAALREAAGIGARGGPKKKAEPKD